MTIILTLPHFIPDEAQHITRMLRQGLASRIHLRKPGCDLHDMERLVQQLPADLRPLLSLHDHLELATAYHLGGVHLNSRCPEPPTGWTGLVSRSCHSIEEVARYKPHCDYLSLSPIFNSISKPGYESRFTASDIRQAAEQGIIDSKVLALGGVRLSMLQQVKAMGFGGAMILGDAWRQL